MRYAVYMAGRANSETTFPGQVPSREVSKGGAYQPFLRKMAIPQIENRVVVL